MIRSPYLPDVALPLAATTRGGEVVRIRRLVPGEPRVESRSTYDDWGTIDVEFDEARHARAMVEVRTVDDPGWRPVGDLSWHAEFHGATRGSRAITIGISLAADERGRGIGTTAQSLIANALHAAGIRRVQASTDVLNVAEQRALERAGFVREGVARQAQARADGQHDLVLYSCLPGEPRILPS